MDQTCISETLILNISVVSGKYTGWRPVVAVFCNIFVSCYRYIMLSDSVIWLNKLGVNFSTLPIYFLKLTIVWACKRSLNEVTKKSKIMRAAYQWWPSLLP